jgi:hypothetical protein
VRQTPFSVGAPSGHASRAKPKGGDGAWSQGIGYALPVGIAGEPAKQLVNARAELAVASMAAISVVIDLPVRGSPAR